ncbi:hypothetical protein [Endozoicomonas sp. ONNA2]|uniref:hypothetical protein n=1 Tax=Endozoicomonas sp. ONNA2 TaxID=2828741 RepID=UPI0021476D4D|nr:hypothetical protein [Endozoicomonas sp. ONNA2]
MVLTLSTIALSWPAFLFNGIHISLSGFYRDAWGYPVGPDCRQPISGIATGA